jgi:hypothetical protein
MAVSRGILTIARVCKTESVAENVEPKWRRGSSFLYFSSHALPHSTFLQSCIHGGSHALPHNKKTAFHF